MKSVTERGDKAIALYYSYGCSWCEMRIQQFGRVIPIECKGLTLSMTGYPVLSRLIIGYYLRSLPSEPPQRRRTQLIGTLEALRRAAGFIRGRTARDGRKYRYYRLNTNAMLDEKNVIDMLNVPSAGKESVYGIRRVGPELLQSSPRHSDEPTPASGHHRTVHLGRQRPAATRLKPSAP